MPSAKRERQRARREKRQAKEKRREQLIRARRRGATIITLAVIAVALVLAFQALSGEPDPTEEASVQPVACGGIRPDPPAAMSFSEPEGVELPPGATVTATLVTSCGEITIELDQKGFPATAGSFVFLANEGFYNGTTFHRIIEPFMVQGGDPTGRGTGGPGYTIPDEHPPPGFVFSEGVVAMANSGQPGSTGSQFFIVTGPNASHLERFNVLGRVIAGEDSLRRIAAIPVVPDARGELSKPLETAYVEEIRVEIVP